MLSKCAAEVTAADPPRQHKAGVAAVASGALSKGVNLTDIFSQGVSMATLRRDIQGLRSAGFRHVRLPVSASWVLTWPTDPVPDTRLRRLDDTVCAAASAGLAVILDMHPEDDLAVNDATGPGTIVHLATAWSRLAGRYAIFPPGLVVFEAMNEPGRTDPRRWERDQRLLLDQIRRAAPDHTVLLTASPSSTAGALAGLQPVADGNVAYVFHFYSPMVFTHQGADWSSPELGSIRALAYPAIPGNVAAVRRSALPAVQELLAEYQARYSSPAGIQAEIAVAAHWAKQNGVPLIVTEFGVYGAAAPANSRVAWLGDVRRALEAHAVGWTVWEYRGGFGIDADLKRCCGVPSSVRRALDLCPADGSC